MKKLLLLIGLLSIAINAQTAGSGVTDIDGNFYPSVIIGNQEWITVNLKTTKYKNGDVITGNTQGTPENGSNWANYTTGRVCYYYSPDITTEDGFLYNWYAVNDARGLAPEGWRIPTKDDWITLKNNSANANFGNNLDVLRKTEKWSCVSTNNSYNFSIIASGARIVDNTSIVGNFSYGPASQNNPAVRSRGYFWTSTSYLSVNDNIIKPYYFMISCDYKWLQQLNATRASGFSIRVVKDVPLSINQFNKSDIKIYPNPVQNQLNIESQEIINGIEIFDLLGKKIFESKSKTIDVSGLQSGIYLLKINTENGILTQKIIKQ